MTERYNGNDVCIKCESHEIPLSRMPHCDGEDVFFSCSQCHWSWYVALYDNGDEPVITDDGYFYDTRGEEE